MSARDTSGTAMTWDADESDCAANETRQPWQFDRLDAAEFLLDRQQWILTSTKFTRGRLAVMRADDRIILDRNHAFGVDAEE